MEVRLKGSYGVRDEREVEAMASMVTLYPRASHEAPPGYLTLSA
jgi:hypothetical protein